MLFCDTLNLRQSCDRCHSRKQRCIRNGNEACRRCRESGEKCIHSPPLRSGRPKTKRATEDRPGKKKLRRITLHAVTVSPTPSDIGNIKAKSCSISEKRFTVTITPQTPSLEITNSDTSPKQHAASTTSSTIPTALDGNAEFWNSFSNTCELPAYNNFGLPPDALFDVLTENMDESWSEGSKFEWQPDKTSASNESCPMPAEFTQTDSSWQDSGRTAVKPHWPDGVVLGNQPFAPQNPGTEDLAVQ